MVVNKQDLFLTARYLLPDTESTTKKNLARLESRPIRGWCQDEREGGWSIQFSSDCVLSRQRFLMAVQDRDGKDSRKKKTVCQLNNTIESSFMEDCGHKGQTEFPSEVRANEIASLTTCT